MLVKVILDKFIKGLINSNLDGDLDELEMQKFILIGSNGC